MMTMMIMMVPTALKWSDGVKLMVTTHFDLISGPLRVPRGPKGVMVYLY